MRSASLLFCFGTIAAQPAVSSGNRATLSYNGREQQLDVAVPRIEASAVIDGELNEPVWQQAAHLHGFSRYAPTDGDAADDSTQVLVWYSPTAMYIGVRAFAEPGTVRATLADRDKMFNDDYIGIFIGTFNDRRQATVFAANPLGVQGDGILVESGQSSSGFGGLAVGREPTDISPDYVFQSKGHVTDYGYEIEFRIPFKSLTYQPVNVQTWSFNVLRKVQSRGYEYSWAPARRAAASYIGQHGHLIGLTNLSRGLVLDVNPVVTRQVNGTVGADGYRYADHPFKFGGNVRWGITNNLTMNGTFQPDFAEVESDANQLVTDPRQALRFPEKRPFFLDGVEQFNVPSNLVYTRRILSPLAAIKFTGKIAGTSVAYLSAVDDSVGSVSGHDRPLYNILRVQRDVNSAARIGLIFTDKEEGVSSNRVGGADFRINVNNIYSASLQSVWSSTVRPNSPTLSGPLWTGSASRQGRRFGARYTLNGISDDFRTNSGFISRPAIVHANLDHRYTIFGQRRALLDNMTLDLSLDGIWQYRNFMQRRDAIEKKLHINVNYTFRGGWTAGTSLLLETFGFDPSLYSAYAIERHVGAVVDT
ncbi:MAG: carbohydrate binding family 9 domain-containing protein, partial [Gemmatimonadota bacterium]|nr:carbohydrate binding family 9 domain-containing protein [Gemmatimonadota bacterium]